MSHMLNRVPTVREKLILLKVREESGNFIFDQGNLSCREKTSGTFDFSYYFLWVVKESQE